MSKKSQDISSSKHSKTKEINDDDFIFHYSAQSRSKSTPRRVRFAEKPLCPESDPEDSIILRDQIQNRLKSGLPPQPILKDTEYVPPKPSKFRLFKRRLIRKTKKNARKIVGILLFLAFSFLLYYIMFRWGKFKGNFDHSRNRKIYGTNNVFTNDEKSHLFIRQNVPSNLHGINNYPLNSVRETNLFNLPDFVFIFAFAILIGLSAYIYYYYY